MAIHDSPGRGRKLCPSCEKYVGVRSSVCPNCNAEFSKKPAPSKPVTRQVRIQPAPQSQPVSQGVVDTGRGLRVVAIAAGRCPHRLDSTVESDVLEWADKVRAAGRSQNYHYTNMALRHFARQFFPSFSEELEAVKSFLPDEAVMSYVGE